MVTVHIYCFGFTLKWYCETIRPLNGSTWAAVPRFDTGDWAIYCVSFPCSLCPLFPVKHHVNYQIKTKVYEVGWGILCCNKLLQTRPVGLFFIGWSQQNLFHCTFGHLTIEKLKSQSSCIIQHVIRFCFSIFSHYTLCKGHSTVPSFLSYFFLTNH